MSRGLLVTGPLVTGPLVTGLLVLGLLVLGMAARGEVLPAPAPGAPIADPVAPAAPPGSWIVALRFDRLYDAATGTEELGGSSGLDYLHRFAGGATFSAGFEAFRLAGVEWLTAGVAGSRPLSPGTTVYGGFEVGPGREGEAALTYVATRAGLIRRLGARPLFATLEGRYFDIGQLRGGQVLVTLTGVVGGRHQLSATYGRSPGGELGDDLYILRWDGRAGGRPLFGGLARGESRPEALGPTAQGRVSHEVFVGAGLPSPRGELALVLAHQDLEGASRASLTFVARLPRLLAGSS